MDYFDTVNAGVKTDKESYMKIAKAHVELGSAEHWLFLSDNVKEVRAAKAAGMQSFVVVREGNAELSEEDRREHVVIDSFNEIRIKGL